MLRSVGQVALLMMMLGSQTSAQQLAVEFEILEGGEAAGCPLDIVSGLDPGGDGFLAVRTGPASEYPKIDELHEGDQVRPCAARGEWRGIYYGEPRRKGWVHGNWLVPGAG